MYQFILDRVIKNSRARAMIALYIQRQVTRFFDPVVHYNFNGVLLAINLSHQLPLRRILNPYYSENLGRLALFIQEKYGHLRMIDVGANVGDSFCLMSDAANSEILLIEGDKRYFQLLTDNTKQCSSVTRVNALLSDEHIVMHGKLIMDGGTAHISHTVEGGEVTYVTFYTLDEVIGTNPQFASANLLKTDVDGYDCKVIMGGLSFIGSATPTIFFEHHPRLLADAREDDLYIFAELANIGYDHFIFYDNVGYLMGVVSAIDTQLIRNLMLYGKYKRSYYYDICAFHQSQTELRDEFISREWEFFKTKAKQ